GMVTGWNLEEGLSMPATTERIYSQDGSRFLNRSNDVVEVRGAIDEKLIGRWTTGKTEVATIESSDDGRFVLCESRTGGAESNALVLGVRNASTGAGIGRPITVSNSTAQPKLIRNGELLVAAAGDKVQAWRIANGKLLWEGGAGGVIISVFA